VNPYSYHLHAHLAEYLRDPYMAEHVNEYLTLSFRHPTAIYFEAMLLVAAVAICWSAVRGRFTEAVVLLVWGHAALLAGRNIPIFMVAAAPLVAASVQEWLDILPRAQVAGWLSKAVRQFQGTANATGETEAVARLHLASAAGIGLVVLFIWAPNAPRKFRAEFDPGYYPARALPVLRQVPSARIFTHDEWGDYLIWSLYPTQRVFVDGRTDFYGPAFGRQYMEILNVNYDWERILNRFGVDTILMPPGAPLTGALKESSRWKLVYDDGVAVIFRPVTAGGGAPVSVAALGGGTGRGRETTKLQAGDPPVAGFKSKT
jgi:hypothetical protein